MSTHNIGASKLGYDARSNGARGMISMSNDEDVTRSENVGTYFGRCPECDSLGEKLNINQDHWFVCHEHKVKWNVGSNSMSDWQVESTEMWEQNEAALSEYREVEPSQ